MMVGHWDTRTLVHRKTPPDYNQNGLFLGRAYLCPYVPIGYALFGMSIFEFPGLTLGNPADEPIAGRPSRQPGSLQAKAALLARSGIAR